MYWVRSFAITLAIAITIVGPRARCFTIDRTDSTITTSSDFTTNSLSLQVKDDLKSSNGTTSKHEDENITIKSNEISTSTDKTSIASEIKTEKRINVTRTTTEVISTTEYVKIPTISSDTVEVFDSVEDTTYYNYTWKTNSDKESTTTEKSKTKITKSKPTSVVTTEPLIELTTILNLITTESDITTNYPTRSLSNEKTISLYNVTENPITTELITAILSEKETDKPDFNKTEFIFMTTDLPQTISNVSETTISDINLPTAPVDQPNKDVAQTTTEDTKITEAGTDNYTINTSIIRKRTTNSVENTVTLKTEDSDMKAETTNTQVNFEKAFNITPIPSLEKLRVDLLSNINQRQATGEIPQGTAKATREVEFTAPTTIEGIEPKKLVTVELKRAGYLDNSQKTTTPVIFTIAEEMRENVTETIGNVENKATTEAKSPDDKKVRGSESHSLMAEYALQEELLKEEALNNHKENAIRYHEQRTGMEVLKLDDSVVSAVATEDSLSVQPIERTKTTLYTPSPNYKPMKKIDVQPAKPFVRDPDDNSWRNESISSLGIVFKPKNSSISFKEVLRNKTQTELNSFTERTKDDVPDLRLRLEKIAEVRKTKKKKMNKDGEVVYTDYEENSAETSSTQKPAQTESLTPQPNLPTKIELELTTSMTIPDKIEGPKEQTTTKKLDIFRLGLEALTSEKPGKFYNLAEYYDTTDEYDADYVTMSKIDLLKKFTVPPRTTYPAPVTRPVEPYLSERRPTVQYFPPRQPPVSVNNVDKDFERKINMFSFKDLQRIEPFATIAPVPIATWKPEEPRPAQGARPTASAPSAESPPADLGRNYYQSSPPTTESEAFLIDSGRLDRGSYVIKHYKDFLNAAVDDVERAGDFLPLHTTEAPRETFSTEPPPPYKSRDDDEDYDMRFRKEVLNRFVNNFNQNSERFKIDFPILYNSSVVHRPGTVAPGTVAPGTVAPGTVAPASSRTFLKRLYHEGVATRATGLAKKACEPNCEVTVDLSPAYELHYYVPNQEERQEQEARPPPAPYRYGL